MISSPGVGSGLDVSSLVTQLVAIEQQPLIRLVQQEANFQGQISAFGALKSALSTFDVSLSKVNSESDFSVLAASSSNEDVFTASAVSTASKGTFNLTVERIAESHRMGASAVFVDIDTATIGGAGDSLTFDQNGESFDIEFGGKTLGEIRDLINSAGDNTGVTASILKDDSGYRLLLNAADTGSENFVSLSYSAADPFGFSDLNTDRNGDLGFTAADLDAELTVDGAYSSTHSSNTITNLVQGVTIKLVDAGTATLKIDENDGAVQSSVQSFVDAYNTALGAIRDLRAGALSDDSNTLFAMENQIRQILNSPAPGNGTYSSIYEIGISSTFVLGGPSQDNGKLNLDAAALQNALDEDKDSVAALFADPDTGLIPRLESVLGSFIDFEGFIDGKTDSLNRRIDSVTDRREVMSRRIDSYEARLLAEFNALDSLVAQLQLSGNFLNQQLSLLQPINNNG